MRKLILAMLAVVLSVTLSYAESCSNVGAKEKKYTAQGDCGYKTEKRTCCDDGNWSGWNEDCPKDCGYEARTGVSFYYGYINGGSNSGPERVGEETIADYDGIFFDTKTECEAGAEAKAQEFVSRGFKRLGSSPENQYSNSLKCYKEGRFNEIEFRVKEGKYSDGTYSPCSCSYYTDSGELGGCMYEIYIFSCSLVPRVSC